MDQYLEAQLPQLRKLSFQIYHHMLFSKVQKKLIHYAAQDGWSRAENTRSCTIDQDRARLLLPVFEAYRMPQGLNPHDHKAYQTRKPSPDNMVVLSVLARFQCPPPPSPLPRVGGDSHLLR